jgi:uncharacterized membrane protein
MLSALKMAALIASVVWILIVIAMTLLIALLSEYPFFASPLNWVLILSPIVPLGIFYVLDRYLRD